MERPAIVVTEGELLMEAILRHREIPHEPVGAIGPHSRIVRRVQDCIGEMQLRFGATSSAESVHLGATEEEVNRGL